MEQKKILEIAVRLAKQDVNELTEFKRQKYSQEKINEYLERKSYHTMNMLNLLKEGKSWASYGPIVGKAKIISKKENPFFE